MRKRGKYIEAIKTTQLVSICFNFKEGTNIKLTQKEADDINKKIIDIVIDNITVDEIDDRKNPELFDGGFDTYPITDEYDYEFWISIPIIYKCRGFIDTSYHNGDPNDFSDTTKFYDDKYKGIEDINKSEILKKLLQLNKIGEFIEESSLYISIDNVDPDNIEYIEDEPEYYDEDRDKWY